MNSDHRIIAIEKDIAWMRENLKLQAKEYERRLTDLNHAHERSIQLSHTYVTQQRHDDYVKTQARAVEVQIKSVESLLKAERDAWERSLQRMDERFSEFRDQYELRHEEVTVAVAAQHGAAEATQSYAQHMHQRMLVAVGGLGAVMTLVVLIANHTFG